MSSVRMSAGAVNSGPMSSRPVGSAPLEHAPTDGLFVVASAPAGWYEVDEQTRRWFDGRRWTDHYAPVLRLVPEFEPVPTHHTTNHGFHLIMLIMTIGAWAPVWVTVTVCNVVRSVEAIDTRRDYSSAATRGSLGWAGANTSVA